MNNESASEEQSSLKALQDILHNRIKQKKREVHDSHNKSVQWKSIERDRNIAIMSCADINYQARKALNFRHTRYYRIANVSSCNPDTSFSKKNQIKMENSH